MTSRTQRLMERFGTTTPNTGFAHTRVNTASKYFTVNEEEEKEEEVDQQKMED